LRFHFLLNAQTVDMAKLGPRDAAQLACEVAALQRLGAEPNPHATQLLAVHDNVCWPAKNPALSKNPAKKQAQCSPGLRESKPCPRSKRVVLLVLEHCAGGELLGYLQHGHGPFSEALARTYFRQLLVGLSFCHARGVAHRDVKLENLLLDANGQLKLCDFGLAAVSLVPPESATAAAEAPDSAAALASNFAAAAAAAVAEAAATESGKSDYARRTRAKLNAPRSLAAAAPPRCDDAVGTRSYMAPEVYDCGRYGPNGNQAHENTGAAVGTAAAIGYDPAAADVWSCGVVLFTLLAGHPPFDAPNAQCDWWFRAVASGRHDRFWQAHERTAPHIPRLARQLLNRAFVIDPAQRATLAELLQHPWLHSGPTFAAGSPELAAALAPKAAAVERAAATFDKRAAAETGAFDGRW
jgi:serine/threonine protein kinase